MALPNRKGRGKGRKSEDYLFEEGTTPVKVHTFTPGIHVHPCKGTVFH
jgi:hypothetical protein